MKSLSRYLPLFFSLASVMGAACAKTPYVTQSQVSPKDSVEPSVVVTYLDQPYENYLSYTVELFLPKGSVVRPAYANGYSIDDTEYVFVFNHILFSTPDPDYPPDNIPGEAFIGTTILGKQQNIYGAFASLADENMSNPSDKNIKEYGYFLEPGRHTLTAGERFTLFEVGDDAYYFDVVSIRD